MRRKYLAIGILLAISAFYVPSAQAATSQGLEWGVSIGDRFDFLVSVGVSELPLHNETFYLNVTDTPVIPDPFDNYTELPQLSFSGLWTNDTPMGESLFLLSYAPTIAVPIGNWDLLSQVAENMTWFWDEPVSVEMTHDDLYRWGFTYTFNFTGEQWEIGAVYSKIDGFLVKLSYLVYNEFLGEYTFGYWIYRDGVLPTISHPLDVVIGEGDTGYNIIWTGYESEPAAYEIYLTNVSGTYLVQENLWNCTCELFVWSLDGLSFGTYALSLVLHEASGFSSYDTVIVEVEDRTDPIVTHPEDIIYTVGVTGNNFTWIMEDLNPSSYEVYVNGEMIGSGNWNARVASIDLNVDDLTIGTYNYTIVLTDLGGNIITDQVIVTVDADFLTSNLPLILSGIGIVGIVVVVVFLVRSRKSVPT
ncbi:MAG: hypothetical protein RTU92_00830 [Candidatus Thorarchaeota archaeon]